MGFQFGIVLPLSASTTIRLPSIFVPSPRLNARFISSSLSNSMNAYPVGFPVASSFTIFTCLMSPYLSNSLLKTSPCSSSQTLYGNLATNNVAYGSPVAFSFACGSHVFKACSSNFLPFSNLFFVFCETYAGGSFFSA